MSSCTNSPASACPFFFLPASIWLLLKLLSRRAVLSMMPHAVDPYIFTLQFTYVSIDVNTVPISLLQNTFMYDICLSLGFYLISLAFSLLFHPLSWLLILYLLNFFSLSTLYLDTLIHFHGLKYHLCADSSQTCICETACSSKLQSPPSNCLLYISIWMSHRCLKFNIFKIEIFHYSSLCSLPYHISLPLNLAQLNKCNYLCSFAQEKK